jgi:hypothetical protein
MFSIERALWEITDSRERVGQFLQDADGVLAEYQLSATERELIKARNVRALADLEVSSMLLMLFWMAVSGGSDSMPEYLQRMNSPA